MGPINLQVRYRPIRIGWCVREGDFEELRKALRLTHTFWGGASTRSFLSAIPS